MLALTSADVDLEKQIITSNKSHQRLDGKDVITDPKTPKSNRIVTIPQMLVDCLRKYMTHRYGLEDDHRLFPYTKHFLYHEMQYDCEISNVKDMTKNIIQNHNHPSNEVGGGNHEESTK